MGLTMGYKWLKEPGFEITDLMWNGTPCWRWLGAHNTGRPVLNQKQVYRIFYERERGPLPPGHDAHHNCEHMWCINPWHIEPLTRQAHLKLHGKLHGNRFQSSKTHCIAGHPFDEANIYWMGNKRRCRACGRAANAAYLKRKAAQRPDAYGRAAETPEERLERERAEARRDPRQRSLF
jgi:hypothetical protein